MIRAGTMILVDSDMKALEIDKKVWRQNNPKDTTCMNIYLSQITQLLGPGLDDQWCVYSHDICEVRCILTDVSTVSIK